MFRRLSGIQIASLDFYSTDTLSASRYRGRLLAERPLLRLFLGDFEGNQFSFLPFFGPLLPVDLNQFAFAVANVVVVCSGEDVATSERVLSFALLNTIDPLAFVYSSVILVLVASLSMPDSFIPLALVDISVRVRIFAFAMFLIFLIAAFIFETVRF